MNATSSAETSPAVVELRGVHHRFGENPVLNGVDLCVRAGEVVVIIGPSGCGKSTLLRCLNLLERPSAGELWFQGTRVTDEVTALRALRARVGMVFQRFHLFPHLNVRDNLCLAPAVVRREPRGRLESRAEALLTRVGLAGLGGAWPEELSGGQQQRVAIARCLMMEPELMLFDEPTSALDPELVGGVLGIIQDLAADGRTLCVVTHEINFAREVASTVLMLDSGRIIEAGPPDQVLERPQHERTRSFLRRVLERSRD